MASLERGRTASPALERVITSPTLERSRGPTSPTSPTLGRAGGITSPTSPTLAKAGVFTSPTLDRFGGSSLSHREDSNSQISLSPRFIILMMIIGIIIMIIIIIIMIIMLK